MSRKAQPVNILLVGLPNLLMQIISTVLSASPGLITVGRADDADTLAAQVRQVTADVVIIPDGLVSPHALLRECPAIRIISLDHDGSGAILYHLQVQAVRLKELSAELLNAVLLNTHAGRPH
jgi:chemotaxis response regulator CheB